MAGRAGRAFSSLRTPGIPRQGRTKYLDHRLAEPKRYNPGEHTDTEKGDCRHGLSIDQGETLGCARQSRSRS